MAAFEYVALDVDGRERSGVVSAATEGAARQELIRRRLAPVRIAASAGNASGEAAGKGADRADGARRFAPRFGDKALALVTRQLATLISVAPLEESLRTIAVQAGNATVRRVLLGVHAQVLEGYRLSDAMARQGESFPPMYRAMVAAGESSGALPTILERLADLMEKQEETRAKVMTALVYPTLLAATALIVVVALMTFVVPRIVEQFDGVGQDLPLLTQIVIALSGALRDHGLFALLALAVGALAFSRAMRAAAFRYRVDRAILLAPLIGHLSRDLHAARLARTLSTMLASGLPVLESLVIAARTVRNEVLRRATNDMAEAIREGGSLSGSMRRAAVFPPILVYLAASGEESGKLDVMLGRAADYLEREFNTFTSVALSLLEPAIILVMAVLVTGIVLSILLPILQLNTLAFS